MLLLRPSRHPLLFLLSLALFAAGVLQWVLYQPVTVPAEYAGLWRSGPTSLEIRPEGVAIYRTGDGVVSRSGGGTITALEDGRLTYRSFLLPRQLRIDAPPAHAYDDLWTMTIEGQVLWRVP